MGRVTSAGRWNTAGRGRCRPHPVAAVAVEAEIRPPTPSPCRIAIREWTHFTNEYSFRTLYSVISSTNSPAVEHAIVICGHATAQSVDRDGSLQITKHAGSQTSKRATNADVHRRRPRRVPPPHRPPEPSACAFPFTPCAPTHRLRSIPVAGVNTANNLSSSCRYVLTVSTGLRLSAILWAGVLCGLPRRPHRRSGSQPDGGESLVLWGVAPLDLWC